MKKNRLFVFLIVFMVAAGPIIGGATAQTEIEGVCMITNEGGRVNDGTFNTLTYDGMLRAAEDFDLETTFIETVGAADYEANFEICVDEGFDIILTVGFLITDATFEAAQANPDVLFVGIDQFYGEALPNLVGLQFREDQGGFMAGALAAMMTESGVVGGVYGQAIPPVVRFRTGFENGVRYIDPDVTALGAYIDDFNDPAGGAATAEQYLGEGADVIMGAGGPTGSGAITFAAQQGALVIGVDLDEYFTTFGGGETPGAENIISSSIKRVDNGVYDMIAAAVDGTGFPENSLYVLEVANEGIGFAPPNEADVPEDVTADLEAILTGLQIGEIMTGADPVTGAQLGTIRQVLEASGDFGIMLDLYEAADLLDRLESPGPITVLALTDETINAALSSFGITQDALRSDPGLLSTVLRYHLLSPAIYGRILSTETTVTAANGANINVDVTERGIRLNRSATVTTADINAANGLIHVISRVLLPPGVG
ncbi:MAG: BMP family ABC transporter substrate-binding protein [Chloroflexi bacterium]|nr:BMP family ABC transporter substrate-binding protein [Chloroflexota bacterium]